jgi:hypothetical protein
VCAGDFLADQLASLALVLDGGLPCGARRFFLVGKRLAKRKPPALKCSFVDHGFMKKPAEAGKTFFFKARVRNRLIVALIPERGLKP